MGEIYALGCALVWAFAVVLLRRCGETVGPFALNLFRVVLSLPLLAAAIALSGEGFLREAPLSDYILLMVSGVLSIAIADTLFHWSLNLVGAGVTAIIDTSYSPMTVLLAFLLIGERISALDLVGMGLIVGAVLASTTVEPLPGPTRSNLVKGVVVGIVHIFFLTLGIVIAKPVLDHSPVLWATGVRQIVAALMLVIMGLISPRRREHFAVFRPAAHWRYMVPATVLGSFFSLVLWIAGMKYALASVAAILNQSSTIWILLLSVLLLREPMTPRKVVSAVLALGGVLLVMLN